VPLLHALWIGHAACYQAARSDAARFPSRPGQGIHTSEPSAKAGRRQARLPR
jgi:hypothetical protein